MSKKKIIIILILIPVVVSLIVFGKWLFTLQEEEQVRDVIYTGGRKAFVKADDGLTTYQCGWLTTLSTKEFSHCRIEITCELENGVVEKIVFSRQSDGKTIIKEINEGNFTYDFELDKLGKNDSWEANALVTENSKGNISWKCYIRRYGYQILWDRMGKASRL